MSVNERYVQAQHELINAGFRPERFGFLVKFVRRFLWPFIRPFHFYELRKLIELESELNKHNSAVLQESYLQLRDKLTGEMEKLVREHVFLHSDMEALKNRYMLLEALDDRVASLDSKAETFSGQLAELHKRIDANDNQIETIGHQLEDKPARGELEQLRESIAKFPPRELAVTSTKFGLYIGKPGEIISDHIFRGGVWDQHILDLAQKVSSERNGRALDVGGHLGSVTLGLATLFKEVVSFEPNDFNFKILKANVAINGLQNVRLFNSGVYSRETKLALGEQEKQEIAISTNASGEFDGHSANNLGAYLFSEQENGVFEHAARTIDSYHFEDVSFIKIDVQGADGEVLMGALETIRRCRPVVVFEWEELLSRHFSVTFEDVLKSLSDLGYVIDRLKVHNEKQIDYVASPAIEKM
jgi:FkbM family methyltransferase